MKRQLFLLNKFSFMKTILHFLIFKTYVIELFKITLYNKDKTHKLNGK